MGERVKREIRQIDYSSTKSFFENREKKFKESNPYSVTMYQDNNPELVEKRNKKEVETLLPLLKLNNKCKVLDIACGIGRWSDAIHEDIEEYCGIDFSEGFIKIARERNAALSNRSFFVGAAGEIVHVLKNNYKETYDRILMIGILMYLNDNDIGNIMSQVESICDKHAIICIREPIGVEERLTLNNVFSEELEHDYSAIYRTRDELMDIFEQYLLSKGFNLCKEAFLFREDELNNRKETVQYYFVFER